MASETTFARAFVSLLDPSSLLATDYVKDKAQLDKKPLVAMPKMPEAKKKTGVSGSGLVNIPIEEKTAQADVVAETIEITIKTLKAPKLMITLSAPSDDSIFNVKQLVVKQAAEQGVTTTADSVKLLIKGKVVPDSKILGDVAVDGKVAFIGTITEA
ncbi:hypothetical protein B0I72DRAFT_92553 [Yarrowia lipolytica]|uniref:YALI0B17061p n=2 Tax=Yarrowia lipolytica TaxID=4952 RepID=B5FVB4_YARLI|nr:YALI0B17061p [Yarrowia lipolytica CLIB122]AOW01822.1 hypothetical protein YALI1_B22266g [Yarrowia lipolytica]KAB8285058.1 hypothetical protein BKA91DRAFT_166264 [Yarrowia lipolytica]KAE8175018.1 hypothetical protein BKA90DRAFT_165879 [Yarrowia lipolytica]KAJ8052614.1 hypothetical protein LXG23DRAFT_52096 [Yarrowia lipolytica]QNP96824.1 Hypothetical protein YALI2_C00477g [Yarrowia lipolytica]|eukprot:XP_002143017.1 YALI0B17061p [Yarrowia lipolytica CLIB122]